MPGRRIVVVGGALAGPAAAARAREVDERAEILLLERAPEVSYAVGGLAYHLSGEVPSLASLNREKARFFRDVYNVDVRLGVEVTGIDPDKHRLSIRGKHLTYDRLVVATGARSVIPPVPGLSNSSNVFPFRRFSDLKGIVRLLDKGATNVVILGGGHFGVEAADGFARRRGRLKVTVVESGDRILSSYAPLASRVTTRALEAMGAKVLVSKELVRIKRAGRRVESLQFDDGSRLRADIVVVTAGVEPRTDLLQGAGARLHSDGSVVVDNKGATNLPDVFACGVCVGVKHAVTGKRFWQAQATFADRTAQVAGANAAGDSEQMPAFLGTSIVRAGEIAVGRTGWTDGAPPHVRQTRVHGEAQDSFFPGAAEVSLTLHHDRRGGRIVGAEVVGGAGTDKRLDVLATAILGRLTTTQLAGIDLGYAPPFGITRDPVNVAGRVTLGTENGLASAWSLSEIRRASKVQLIDVGKTGRAARANDLLGLKSKRIPLEKLRQQMSALRKRARGYTVIFLSQTGRRGYLAARIARGAGLETAGYLAGGFSAWME